ncbi:MAG: VWA domain-containing protein [Terriglobia bacterium]
MRTLSCTLAVLLLTVAIPARRHKAATPPSFIARHQRAPAATSYHRAASIHVQSSLVVAPVTVIDHRGNFVESLRRRQFRVLDNGVPQRITQFGLAIEPVTAVILVETDRRVAPLLNHVRPLGSEFWGLLLGNYGASAVIAFGDRVRLLQDFSTGPKTLERTLRRLSARGHNARLNDAMADAIRMLAEQPITERRVIVVFSEGFDRGSKTSEAEVLRAATAADVAVYGLRFGRGQAPLEHSREEWNSDTSPSVDFLPLVELGLGIGRAALSRNLIQQYASFTGGVVYTHWKRQTLQDELQRIALEINSQYIVAYVPSTLRERGFHRIEIKLAQPSLQVRVRAGYFTGSKAK